MRSFTDALTSLLGKSTSIRRRILIAVSAVYLLCSGITVSWIYLEVRHEVDELFDAEMIQQAKTLAVIVAEPARLQLTTSKAQSLVVPSLQQHSYEDRIAYRIEALDGSWQVLTEGVPDAATVPFQTGFTTYQGEQLWHVFGMLTADGQSRILLLQEDEFRAELRSDLAIDTIFPVLLLLPLMLWLGWLAIHRGFKSFARLAQQLRLRSNNNYAPFPLANEGEEVDLVKRSLNHYLARIEQSFAREKRFSADAAHELRTPLAALKVRLQRLQERPPSNFQQEITELLESTNRIINLVESLLTLAKVEGQLELTDTCDLAKVWRQVLADNYARIEAKQLNTELNLVASCKRAGAASYWYLLCNNLLDNAIKYAPAQSSIQLTLEQHQMLLCNPVDSQHQLDITRLTERFYRGKQLRVQGAGLGLSIVAHLATQLQVEPEFNYHDQRFCVQLYLR